VVPGLVTTKTSRIETLEQIKARLDEASSLIDAERLAVSPQCGFATSVAGNAITPRRNAPSLPANPRRPRLPAPAAS
jgi:5-methyltetrahydropteroyltriglutamate--homocysteine methyltransferase